MPLFIEQGALEPLDAHLLAQPTGAPELELGPFAVRTWRLVRKP